jgi:hypothetical protein
MNKQKPIAILLLLVLLLGMGGYFYNSFKTKETIQTPILALQPAPVFDGDSAYAWVAKQVAFGPRVPNTKAHIACGNWLAERLKQYGCEVTVQRFTTQTYDGIKLNASNIIGSINPSASKRVLLAAHWDTRPFADKSIGLDKDKPFDGANDGASGVGILLEIARVIQQAKIKPNVGIDIVFFDAEDWGEKHDAPSNQSTQNFWCLGSQYWAKNPHKTGYTAFYGILLDMVGAKGAVFPKEGTSVMYASGIVDDVWKIADAAGYGNRFSYQQGGGLTDDHTAVNETAKIPMIDIVEMNPQTGDFGSYHHTRNDNMAVIDPKTLKAVGQVVLQTVYQEAK